MRETVNNRVNDTNNNYKIADQETSWSFLVTEHCEHDECIEQPSSEQII